MRLPFGIDLKSLILGMLMAWFALPMLLSLFNGARRPVRTATA